MLNLSDTLKEIGYKWEVTADNYRVWYKEDFIGGAGVQLPRSKPLHWKHAKQNRIENLESAIGTAKSHALRFGYLKGIL
jgi:hypothetical protein